MFSGRLHLSSRCRTSCRCARRQSQEARVAQTEGEGLRGERTCMCVQRAVFGLQLGAELTLGQRLAWKTQARLTAGGQSCSTNDRLSVWWRSQTSTDLWAHASHASGGIHPHRAAHVWMSWGETRGVLQGTHKRGEECVCGRYLEVWWGPGCLAKEAVTQGCSPEAGLAYGGRVSAHLGTAET